ncbi:hypothetical protein MVEN_00117300 [Mycena venus]|uniref:MULE transposase domain-containing protein n=1 Tax=Mycena venus TaxID=2733690 RepID=A0A8H7DEK0_9AGAR|nr:hypothetical protein MVEN_00117300 [Mycena venus]
MRGYNTAILRELLGKWEEHLSRGKNGPFYPYVAITDTDLRERGALLDIWPYIWLLLCKFHLGQCWTNKRKALKLTSSAKDGDFWKDYVVGQIISLEVQLIESMDIQVAHQLITDQHTNLRALVNDNPSLRSTVDAAISFLEYLTSTWMPEAFGRVGRSVDEVLHQLH